MANQIDIDAKVQGETDQGFGQRHIISLSDGTLYTVQINDVNDIEVHESIDDGSSWSLETTLSSLTNPQSLSLCRSENDDLFVGFTNGNAGSVNGVIHKRDSGSGNAWSQVLNQSHPHKSTAGMPGFLITYNRSQNRLHYFFTTQETSNWRSIYNKYSDNKGSTWSSETLYQDGQSGSAEGLINCLGLDTNPLTGDIYLVRQTNVFSRRTRVFKFNANGVFTSLYFTSGDFRVGGPLVIDSSGNIWNISYFRNPTQQLEIERNTVRSLSITATSDEFKRGMHSIGVDGSDNIYVFYVKETDNKCYYRKYTALTTSWGSETVLTTGDGLRPSCEQVSLPSKTQLNIVFFTS